MPSAWVNVVCVALGGAFGCVLRFALGQWCTQRFGETFPWGTLSVNLLGSLAFGVLWGLGPVVTSQAWLRALLLTGVLGGFTTFSSFMFDTARLLEAGRTGPALANLLVQNVVGVVLFCGGLILGRSFAR